MYLNIKLAEESDKVQGAIHSLMIRESIPYSKAYEKVTGKKYETTKKEVKE